VLKFTEVKRDVVLDVAREVASKKLVTFDVELLVVLLVDQEVVAEVVLLYCVGNDVVKEIAVAYDVVKEVMCEVVKNVVKVTLLAPVTLEVVYDVVAEVVFDVVRVPLVVLLVV